MVVITQCECIIIYRGQVRGEGGGVRGGERRGDLAQQGEGQRKLPDTMKSMVMKINTS